MRRLISFTHVSLDGYYASDGGGLEWAHKDPSDEEWNAFVAANASGGGALLFGRVTYDLMRRYWPTEMAKQQNPEVAAGMNSMPKYVCSRTMGEADWSNTTVLRGELVAAVAALKSVPGPGIAILGSGSVVTQLAAAGLIDEFQIVVNPIALGAGRKMFAGLPAAVALRHTSTRTFGNGSVVLCYEPVK